MKQYLTIFILLFSYYSSDGQTIIPPNLKDVICYASDKVNKRYVPPPAKFRYSRFSRGSGQNVQINVTYNGFTPEAQAAFQFAVDIWASILCSDVPIEMDATFSQLPNGVLGSAGPSLVRNFKRGFDSLTFYAIPIAEKIAGINLNGDSPDIVASFSSGIDWYYGTDGNTPTDQFDFVSVVLHELGHGLGFLTGFSGYTPENGSDAHTAALVFDDLTDIYARYLTQQDGIHLTRGFEHPSTALADIFTGNGLFFDNFLNKDIGARIYAPASFNGGSSISHLNESTYNNTPHALMTPQISPGEAIHNPGDITLNMLADMGWIFLNIKHEEIGYIESTGVGLTTTFTSTIKSDYPVLDNSIFVYYSNDNFITQDSIALIASGEPNEYIASSPVLNANDSFGYYISAKDSTNRIFTLPNTLPEFTKPHRFFNLIVKEDNETPIIQHENLNDILIIDTMNLSISAVVTDNFKVDTVFVEYYINGNTSAVDTFGLKADLVGLNFESPFPTNVIYSNDTIFYRIIAVDVSINSNTIIYPSSDFISFRVIGLDSAQDSFKTDFNNIILSEANFFGDFMVTSLEGFTDAALHTKHPYLEASLLGLNEVDFISYLLTPIILDSLRPIMLFDEIVLVEPGVGDVDFRDDSFFDFVIVEASKDLGGTWIPLLNGYDSRDNPDWLTAHNSSFNENNSTAEGTPALYRQRIINMIQNTNFDNGDTLIIRFRLHSDPLANAWGWTIDNLDIQELDITASPFVQHIPIGFLINENIDIPIEASIDHILPVTVEVQWSINNILQTPFILDKVEDMTYSKSFPFATTASVGDVITYSLSVTDVAKNANIINLPSNDFYTFSILEQPQSITNTFITFDDNTNIESGGYGFSIEQPSNFQNNALHSTHAYPDANNLVYYLLTPIKIDHTRSVIAFDEIVLVEPGTSSNTNNSDFGDFVTIEFSDNNGRTWSSLMVYDSRTVSSFLNAYGNNPNSTTQGNSNLYQKRIIDIGTNTIFEGTEVFFRFRLSSDQKNNGWGWAIDNLSIQDPTTEIVNEETKNVYINVYPNPTTSYFTIDIKSKTLNNEIGIGIYTLSGQKVYENIIKNPDRIHQEQINLPTVFPNGIYIIRIHSDETYQTHNLFISR